MALLGNIDVLEKSAGKFLSGGATGQGLYRSSFGKGGALRNNYAGGFDPKSAFPSGYKGGDALVIAQKSGGLGASNTVYGDGDLSSANLAGGLNGASSIVGEGTISNAALALVLSAVASIVGEGAITAAIAGRLDAAASLLGEGDVSAALGALAGAAAAITGTGGVASSSLLVGTGSIAAEIVVTGDALSTANIADAILDAIDGVESGLTLRQALRLIAASTAGKVSISGSTVTIRNAVADDTDRIVATTTTDGERTAITYDTE